MKKKILTSLILLLLVIPVLAIQEAIEGHPEKIFISVGNKFGENEDSAECYAEIYDSTSNHIFSTLMYYEGNGLYYFITNSQWPIDTYTTTVTCANEDGSETVIFQFKIVEDTGEIIEGGTGEITETWFDKIIGKIPFGLGGFFLTLKGVFSIALDVLLFIPKFFVTLFVMFAWSIQHIMLILMLFEVYALSSALNEKGLNNQITIFVQKNVYAIQFIINLSITIVTLGVRLIHTILSTITNLIPFT